MLHRGYVAYATEWQTRTHSQAWHLPSFMISPEKTVKMSDRHQHRISSLWSHSYFFVCAFNRTVSDDSSTTRNPQLRCPDTKNWATWKSAGSNTEAQ